MVNFDRENQIVAPVNEFAIECDLHFLIVAARQFRLQLDRLVFDNGAPYDYVRESCGDR